MRACVVVAALTALACEPVVLSPYSELRLPIVVEGPGFDEWEGEEVELYTEAFDAEGVVEDGALVIVEADALPLDAGDVLTFVVFVDVDDDDDCEGEPALRFTAELRRIGDFYRVEVDFAEGVPTQACATLPDD